MCVLWWYTQWCDSERKKNNEREWSRGEKTEVHTVLFRFPASSSLHHTHATQNYQVDGRASQHSAQMLSGQAGLKQWWIQRWKAKREREKRNKKTRRLWFNAESRVCALFSSFIEYHFSIQLHDENDSSFSSSHCRFIWVSHFLSCCHQKHENGKRRKCMWSRTCIEHTC